MDERSDTDDRELGERLRLSLHHEVPPALDPGVIIDGARRTRARRRVTVLSVAAGLVLVAGGGTLAVRSVPPVASTAGGAAAPKSEDRPAPPAGRTAAPAPDPTLAERKAPVVLEDGVTVSPQGEGFCVRSPRTPTPTCHRGPGSLVVEGATRRWLVFGGPAFADGYAYERAGTWVPMGWRAADRDAPQAYAYAADPPGDGPFRVRRASGDDPTVWVG